MNKCTPAGKREIHLHSVCTAFDRKVPQVDVAARGNECEIAAATWARLWTSRVPTSRDVDANLVIKLQSSHDLICRSVDGFSGSTCTLAPAITAVYRYILFTIAMRLALSRSRNPCPRLTSDQWRSSRIKGFPCSSDR